MADALDVESARGHIGGDDNVDFSGFQPCDRTFALLLRNIAVERRGSEAARLELLGELDGRLLGAREHQHSIEGLGLEYPRERVELVHAADHPIALADMGGGARSWP